MVRVDLTKKEPTQLNSTQLKSTQLNSTQLNSTQLVSGVHHTHPGAPTTYDGHSGLSSGGSSPYLVPI